MKRDTSVRAFSSACGVTLGYNSDVKNVLNACIAGYGEVTATITIGSGGLATVTTAANHNFFKWQVILIAGATSPDQLNGLWKIEDVTASNAFTMLTDYTSGTVTAGTITVKIAPLTYFGAANNYTFSTDTTNGNPISVVITNSTTTSTFTCYSGPAVARTGFLQKANGSGETSVPWYVICNSNALYLICISGNRQYGLALTRLRIFNTVNYTSDSLTENMKFIYPQTSGDWSLIGHQAKLLYAQGYADATLNYPYMINGMINYFGQNGGFFTAGVNPVNNEYVYYPIYATSVYSSVIYMSGIYPGMLALLGTAPANGIYSNMLHFAGSNGYGFCFDLRGPWRY